MDCYVCNTDSVDENHCERCRFELQPLVEWLTSITGDSSITDSNHPFLEMCEDEARYVIGFIAGGQMPFAVEKIGNYTRLFRIDFNSFTYAPFSESI